MALDPAEKELAAAIGFEADFCEAVKLLTGRAFQRLTVTTEEYAQQLGNGLSIRVDRQEVEHTMAKLQPQLELQGYRAYWSEIRAPNGMTDSDEIAILRGTDPYEIIRHRRSNGGNYGVFTGDIIAKLKEWEASCRFQIFGAATDWVAIQFDSLPANVCGFAESIYLLCPDTVEQGVGLLHEREHPEVFAAARELCPELSAEIRHTLDAQLAEFRGMDIPDNLRALFESGAGFGTPTDMGIRLLAYELERTKQLFLWWD
ncbi:MAG: DUF4253 domain-containing protein [Pirellulales bacterium]